MTAIAERYERLPLGSIVPSPTNPRTHFDDTTLDELAESIREHGVIAPIVVRQNPLGAGYELIDGARRHQAAIRAGVADVPARIVEMQDEQVLEVQIVANLQRDDLSPLEEARGYQALIARNPARYSAAGIADRIGRSERYVWDRIKLLDLIPEIQALVDQERILVGHAEVLARLTPEDQARAVVVNQRGYGAMRSGLWEPEDATLGFDADADKSDPYHGMKPRTVAELRSWISNHVRFDIQQAAAAAPLDFGEAAIRVEAAQAAPGRGKKVIAITHDHFVQPDVKTDERVFGPKSWRRADGTEGTSRGGRYGNTPMDSPTCEHAVLGVVVAGRGYGETFEVCIARDRCKVHWKKEIAEKEKTAKLRAKGETAKADTREAKQRQREQEESDRRQREREAWNAMCPKVIAAIATRCQAMPITPDIITAIWSNYTNVDTDDMPEPKSIEDLVRVLAFQMATASMWHQEYLAQCAAKIGFDVVAFVRGEQAEAAVAAAKATPAKATPAKATPAKKVRRARR